MTDWQKIDKNNLGQLRRHYLKYEPYCHVNIIDIWSYRTGPMHWFKVGDTVIYRLNDYMDNSKYFTILGKDSAKDALRELCEKNQNLKKITVNSVPNTTVKALGKWNAVVGTEADPDSHDYVFSTDALINFSSPRLKHKHKTYRKLIRRHPNLKVRLLDHNKEAERRLLYRLFKRWVAQTDPPDWDKELLALKRALNLKDVKLVCLGVFDGRKMIGYTVNEPENNGYYQAHFGKADRHYPGLGLLLEHETAKYIHKHYGSTYMNLQQDLGIEGLRHYKTSLGPTKKLKKYTVEIDIKKALAGS